MLRIYWVVLLALFVLGGIAPPLARGQFTAEQVQQIEEARRLDAQSFELNRQGKFQEALVLAKQGVAIHQNVLGEHDFTSGALNNLGRLLQMQGEHAAALPYLEQALAMKRRTRGDDHLDTALSFNNLGSIFQEMGNYTAARENYERALAIRRRLSPPNDPDLAVSLNNLGSVLQEQGDYAAARPVLEQSLKILRTARGDSHVQTGIACNNLGNLFKAQGDYAAARVYYEQALQVFRKALGDSADTAIALNNVGNLLDSQEDFAGARLYHEQALAMGQKYHGVEHPSTAMSHNNLALALQRLNEFSESRRHYEEALAIYKKTVGEGHISTALTLQNLGYLAFGQQDYAGARPFYEQALKIYGKAVGLEHPGAARTLNNLVNLEARLGRFRAASQIADQGRRGVRQHVARVLPALADREQLMFLRVNDERNLHTALSLGLVRASDSEIVTLSAGWLLNGKGTAQESVAARTLLTRDSTHGQLAPLVAQLTEVRRQLSVLSLAAPKAGQAEVRQAKLAQLTAEEQQLSRQLAQAGGQATNATAWVEVDQVRQALPKSSVLIDFARFKILDFQELDSQKKWSPEHFVAWIIPPAGLGEVQIVDLGPADAIDQAVEQARDALTSAGRADSVLQKEGEAAAEKQARLALQRASDLVWKPLAGKLGAGERLILSPDGALWLLPWSALPVAADKCLLEQFPLQFVVSGRHVAPSLNTASKTAPPVIFADPDFDLGAEAKRLAIQAVFPKDPIERREPTRGFLETHALPRVGRLANTAIEAQLAAPSMAKLAGEEAQSFTANYALESAAKRVQRPKLVLFATHGFFLPDQELKTDNRPSDGTRSVPLIAADGKPIENPLLRCGLLLTGCNTKEAAGGDDGILTGMEIVGIDLRGTELVVLSACETGIGKVNNGEGVAGLRQAFQLAGAKAVVSTLWQVPDRDSALIMNDFFANLAAGQPKADALRSAQLSRLAARRDKFGAAHPFYWAAWTVTGD